MFKLVVLSVLLAVVAAKPYAPYSLLAPSYYHVPSAVSHQSRVDVHHSAPLLAYSAPLVSYAHPLSHSALALGPHTPATVLTPHGVPLETAAVVAAKSAHYQAHALSHHGLHYIHKRSAAWPLAYSVLPTAVSHQSRVDIHSSPALSYHSLPLAYSHAPLHYSHAPLHYSAAPLHLGAPLSLWNSHHHW